MSSPVIEIMSEEQYKATFQRLAHVLHNLRFWTKYWNENYGHHARGRMHYWQQQADDLLDSLGLTVHNNIQSVKVIKY